MKTYNAIFKSLRFGVVGLLVLMGLQLQANETFLSPATKYMLEKQKPVDDCLLGVTEVVLNQNDCEVCFDPTIFLSPGTVLVSTTWNFGDGDGSTLEEPCHVYGAPGTYNVTLTITAINGTETCSCTHNITVIVEKCCPCDIEPNFSYCVDDCEICFTPTIEGDSCDVSFLWIFGDGTTSTDENPCHVFPAEGVYEVCLVVIPTIGGDSCADTICKPVCVEGCEQEPCECEIFQFDINIATMSNCFVGFNSAGEANFCINFMIEWDFGDGTVVTLPNNVSPVHTYSGPGPWTVCATATGIGTITGCETEATDCITFSLDCIVERDFREGDPNNQGGTGMDAELRLFPNPTGSLLHIRHPWMEVGEAKLEVINVSGQTVLRQQLREGQSQAVLDVSDLASGTYYVRMTGIEGQETYNMFIKE